MNELAQQLGTLLRERHLTISTAESCTAGGIGAAIASVDGASEYFLGGVIAYSPEIKNRILGVPFELIRDFGVVSREVAIAMNEGVRNLFHSDIAISITGYAGSSGGDGFAPNGTVWICVTTPYSPPHTQCLNVHSTRTANLTQAIHAALSMVTTIL